ncbi:MAG TPA: GNAT family N-acetyltransferase [Rugosimonospora sp.]
MGQPISGDDGIVLRAPRPADRDGLQAGVDALVTRFVPAVPDPCTPRDIQRWIDRARGGSPDRVDYVIADPGTDEVLGAAGLHHLRWDEGTGEVGYWVAPWARARGVGTATAVALTRWGVARGLSRMELLTHPENWPSQRVAINAGYGREGIRRAGGINRDGSRYDLIVWARLRTDPEGPGLRVLPDLPGGELTDGVVLLRPLWTEDAANVFALRSLPDVVATTVPAQLPRMEQVERRCSEAPAEWLAGAGADLTIRDAASGAFAGEIALRYTEPLTGQAMIGYSLLPPWRGHGFASRACALLATWAFEAVGLARLTAGTAPGNSRSQRVLQRAGFRREGYQHSRLPGPTGTRVDTILYALLPEDLAEPAG